MNLKEKLSFYRINEDEFAEIKNRLGREPVDIEWALFSALWSEHCSYKSSRVHLKNLYNSADHVLESFGENAGVIDLGLGERVAFKMESHNHPSYIEPYQGAATGVGGILRDIFTMGARPIALGDYLCFGKPTADRMTELVDGVVKGIGGYGNCVGVPNVTGQTEFDESYDGNILVNAFALGYFGKDEKVFLSKAKGTGNLLVYVGAKTGRDGVHGASMASESFDDDSESKKPNVQIGDPFFEKCLIESCIEVMKEDLVVAIQDMGAAGITSSSFEMASKGEVGLTLELDKVPVRDSEITAEEILLSESQERMLLVCEPSKIDRIKQVFTRWGLEAGIIGKVLEEKVIKISFKGEELTSIDPDLLVENAPSYNRKYHEWKNTNRIEKITGLDRLSNKAKIEKPRFIEESLIKSLSSINGTSKEWIYRQYDQRVGGNTEWDCTKSIGVVRLPQSRRRLGVVLGGRPEVMRFDAMVAGIDTIAYPALQLASKGFKALATTDCLNFGNPEKENIMTEFVASLKGMSEMAEAVTAPIISGNVSLYNETLGENITSTPSIGLVGIREDVTKELPSSCFSSEEENIFLLKCSGVEIESNSNKGKGNLDSKKIKVFTETLRDFILESTVSSCRVTGKMGLGHTLTKMTLEGVGAKISLSEDDLDSLLVEKLYEVILTMPKGNHKEQTTLLKEKFNNAIGEEDVLFLGETGGDSLQISDEEDRISLTTKEIKESYNSGWKEAFNELA